MTLLMKAKNTDADGAGAGPAPETDSVTARVSSSAATGGAGTTFEQHVGAYWLAQLLVRGLPPIRGQASEMGFAPGG